MNTIDKDEEYTYGKETTEPLISIIVPAYNCEQFIKETIYSIIKQTYRNLEIIIVDDHSTDQTLEICKDLEKLDTRVKSYSCEGKGVSDARNSGINKANGEFIAFVDADDLVSSEHIMDLYSTSKEHPGYLSKCSYQSSRLRHLETKHYAREVKLINREEFMINIHAWYPFVWGSLFSSKTIIENELRFTPESRYWEDVYFVEQYLLFSKGVAISNTESYLYYLREGGLANNAEKKTITKEEVLNRITSYYAYQEAKKTAKTKGLDCKPIEAAYCFPAANILLSAARIGWTDFPLKREMKKELNLHSRIYHARFCRKKSRIIMINSVSIAPRLTARIVNKLKPIQNV